MSNRVRLAQPPGAVSVDKSAPAEADGLGAVVSAAAALGSPGAPEAVEEAAGDRVTVAYVLHNSVSSSWHHSMLQLVIHDFTTSGRVARGGYVAMRCGTGNLVQARNEAVQAFLADRDGDWLLWVDTDMGFTADTVDRLIAVADPVQRPVVGALCFTQREIGRDSYGGFTTLAAPTIFDWVKVEAPKPSPAAPPCGHTSGIHDEHCGIANDAAGAEPEIDPATGAPRGEQQGFAVRYDYTPDAVVQCKGTGSACILVHRSVFERVEAAYGPTWYNRIPNPSMGELTSEDLSFCMRLGTLDIPVYVHTGVKTTHHKTQWIGEDVYAQQRAIVELAEHFKSIRGGTAVTA